MLTRDWTATVFVVQAGRTLLVQHRRLRCWLPPGGHIDPHELPHVAALREVREETGLEVALHGPVVRDLDGVLVLPQPLCVLLEPIEPDHEHIDLIYVGRVTGGTLLSAEHAEHAGMRWFDRDELRDPTLLANVREIGAEALRVAAEAWDGV